MAVFATGAVPVNARGDQRLGALADAIEDQLGMDGLVEGFAGDRLSGAALTDPAFPLILVNSAFSRARSLFTLAHELGPLLRGPVDEGIPLERALAGSIDLVRT